MTELCQIAERHGCDKCPQVGHDYTPVYARIIPRTAKHLLEIGIGSPRIMAHVPNYRPGAGLRMWAEWCPSAEVYGVDIDGACADVSGERIHVAIADATTDAGLFPCVPAFDVIIDDGSHALEHQLASMRLLWPRLASGGVYVVEDVRKAREVLELGEELGGAGVAYVWPYNPMSGDNCLVVFRNTKVQGHGGNEAQ
jgi:hypothetical protein